MFITLTIVVTIAFVLGSIAFWFESKEKKLEKKVGAYENEDMSYRYEVAVLRELQKKIGYSLNVTQVLDTLSANLPMLLPYSVIAALLIRDGKVLFSAHVNESVNKRFLEDLEVKMRASLDELDGVGKANESEQRVTGADLDETKTVTLASFFHVPILVNGDIRAVMTIASARKDAYKEKDMLTVYRIAHAASETLSRFERLLTLEKGKLMGMIGSLGDGAFMVDTENNVSVINPSAKEILHITRDEPSLIDVLTALPNHYDFNGKLQQVMSENEPVTEKNVTIGDRIFHIFLTPVLDSSHAGDQPKVLGVSFVLHDVTVRKSLDQMKEDFTNIMVHELRSPLTSIKASSQLLTSGVALNEEEKTKLLTTIREQSNRLLDEVSAILDAAKMQAGLFKIQPFVSDIKKTIEDKVAVFMAQAEQKSIKLEVQIEPIPQFSFDALHIGQVITNLLSNSFKFTPAGGTIRIVGKQVGSNAQVSVSDTGGGIPKDKQHLLFSKFTQVGTQTAQPSSGLGLYIVKGIIDGHSGTIGLTSEEGKGTTITFTLPIQNPPAPQPTPTNNG